MTGMKILSQLENIEIEAATELLMRDAVEARLLDDHGAELSALLAVGHLHGFIGLDQNEVDLRDSERRWVLQDFIRGQFPYLHE